MLASTNRSTEIRKTEVWPKKSGPEDEGKGETAEGKDSTQTVDGDVLLHSTPSHAIYFSLTPINCIHFSRGTLNITAKDEGLTKIQKNK